MSSKLPSVIYTIYVIGSKKMQDFVAVTIDDIIFSHLTMMFLMEAVVSWKTAEFVGK